MSIYPIFFWKLLPTKKNPNKLNIHVCRIKPNKHRLKWIKGFSFFPSYGPSTVVVCPLSVGKFLPALPHPHWCSVEWKVKIGGGRDVSDSSMSLSAGTQKWHWQCSRNLDSFYHRDWEKSYGICDVILRFQLEVISMHHQCLFLHACPQSLLRVPGRCLASLDP